MIGMILQLSPCWIPTYCAKSVKNLFSLLWKKEDENTAITFLHRSWMILQDAACSTVPATRSLSGTKTK